MLIKGWQQLLLLTYFAKSLIGQVCSTEPSPIGLLQTRILSIQPGQKTKLICSIYISNFMDTIRHTHTLIHHIGVCREFCPLTDIGIVYTKQMFHFWPSDDHQFVFHWTVVFIAGRYKPYKFCLEIYGRNPHEKWIYIDFAIITGAHVKLSYQAWVVAKDLSNWISGCNRAYLTELPSIQGRGQYSLCHIICVGAIMKHQYLYIESSWIWTDSYRGDIIVFPTTSLLVNCWQGHTQMISGTSRIHAYRIYAVARQHRNRFASVDYEPWNVRGLGDCECIHTRQCLCCVKYIIWIERLVNTSLGVVTGCNDTENIVSTDISRSSADVETNHHEGSAGLGESIYHEHILTAALYLIAPQHWYRIVGAHQHAFGLLTA